MVELDFDKMQGLVPVVLQDDASGQVLMVGFMNRAAVTQTLHRIAWSPRRRTSVISASTDCDRDTLLLRVQVQGAGVICHQGTQSCFTEPVDLSADLPGETS